MQVYINRIKDEVLVKYLGIVTKASVVKKELTNDPAPEFDYNQIAFNTALEDLKRTIEDVKEKAELFQLGIESQANFDLKIVEYSDAKAAYEIAKSNI